MQRNITIALHYQSFRSRPERLSGVIYGYFALAASSATYSQFTRFSTNALR